MSVVVMFTIHKNRNFRVQQIKCVRMLCGTSLYESKKICDAVWDEVQWTPTGGDLISVNPIKQRTYMAEVNDTNWADWFAQWMEGRFSDALVTLEDVEHKEGKPCTLTLPRKV